MQLFGTKGQKFLPCPRTKGLRDKLKILPRVGPGWDGISKSGTGCGMGRHEILTGRSRKGSSITGEGHFKTGKEVLKQKSIF